VPEGARLFQEETSRLSPFGPRFAATPKSSAISLTKSSLPNGRPAEVQARRAGGRNRAPPRSQPVPSPPEARASTIPCPAFRRHPHPRGAAQLWASGNQLPTGGNNGDEQRRQTGRFSCNRKTLRLSPLYTKRADNAEYAIRLALREKPRCYLSPFSFFGGGGGEYPSCTGRSENVPRRGGVGCGGGGFGGFLGVCAMLSSCPEITKF